MTWVRLDDAMPDHPKVQGISDKAFRWLVKSWCHAARFTTDGHLADGYVKQVPPAVRRELLASGLWESNGSTGLVVHDYLDFNPSKQTIQDAKNKKAEAGRKGGLAKAANTQHAA